MKITRRDFICLMDELMEHLQYTPEFRKKSIYSVEKGVLDLAVLATNLAARCFVVNHRSANSDVLKQFLIENLQGKVEFEK